MGSSSKAPRYSVGQNKVAPDDSSEGQAARRASRASLKQARKSIQRQSHPFQGRQSLKQAIRRGTLGGGSRRKSSGIGKGKIARTSLPKRKESVLPDIFQNVPKGKVC